ncbi:MAG TPA: hypothetical protein GX000_01435 [Actinomyces sp.]|nr:CrcB family protein [Acidobacteriota bacterium]HHT40302.1 hypothetical protein [Actinomyces sp.]
MIWFLMALAGGLGAYGRYRTELALKNAIADRALIPVKPGAGVLRHTAPAWPIILINIVGSFVAGLLVARVSSEVWLIAGTGLLGGWTTFSTAMVDVFQAFTAQDNRARGVQDAVLIAVIGLVTSVAAALVGLTLGA